MDFNYTQQLRQRAIGRTSLHFKRQVRGQGDGALSKTFVTPSMNQGTCVSQCSCVYAAKIEQFSLCLVCVHARVCVRVHVHALPNTHA